MRIPWMMAVVCLGGTILFMASGCATLERGADLGLSAAEFAPGPYGDAAKTIRKILGPKTKNPVDGWDYRVRIFYEQDDGIVTELVANRIKRRQEFVMVDGIDQTGWGPRLPAGEDTTIPDLSRDLSESDRAELEAALRIFEAIPTKGN